MLKHLDLTFNFSKLFQDPEKKYYLNFFKFLALRGNTHNLICLHLWFHMTSSQFSSSALVSKPLRKWLQNILLIWWHRELGLSLWSQSLIYVCDSLKSHRLASTDRRTKKIRARSHNLKGQFRMYCRFWSWIFRLVIVWLQLLFFKPKLNESLGQAANGTAAFVTRLFSEQRNMNLTVRVPLY